jgi:DNA (cytosine-5)-methyltransferase 1
MGYSVDWKILNALAYGLPQKRERVLIVATLPHFDAFPWPRAVNRMAPLSSILEESPDPRSFVSETIRAKRHEAHTAAASPMIWHENKTGHISSYPWSCALRAGASYNYLLVDGERRLTPREMLRLQGFPDSFQIVCSDSQTRKQAGNAVPVPLAETALKGVLDVLRQSEVAGRRETTDRAVSVGAIAGSSLV